MTQEDRRPMVGAGTGATAGSAGASGAGNAGGNGGSGATGGVGGSGTGGIGGTVAVPAPTYVPCETFAPVYDGSTCTGSCASIVCECESSPRSLFACHVDRGCLTGVDCVAACAADLEKVVTCVGTYEPCTSDADCNGRVCIKEAGTATGDCSEGASGDPCVDDADCTVGSCVVLDEPDGPRGACSAGGSGAPCNQCTNNLCTYSAYNSEGICTTGALNAECGETSDCVTGTCAFSIGLGEGHCTDGLEGSWCVVDGDCTDNRCSTGGNSAGKCRAGTPDDPSENDYDCLSNDCLNLVCQ